MTARNHHALPASPDSVTQQKRARTTRTSRRRPGQRFTSEQRVAAQTLFLESFAKTANVTNACRRAGISRQTMYQWQEHDTAFSVRYHDAEAEANDLLRMTILQRAVTGTDRPLHHNGRLVYDDAGRPVTVKEYSDTLLIFLAKARMPEFRDRTQMELTGKDGGPVEVTDARDILAARLAALTERKRAAEDSQNADA